MRILVTGASGFVGAELIPRLLSEGHTVRGLVRDPTRIDAHVHGQRVDLVTGDVLTGDGLDQALADIELAYYLIHSMERPPSRKDIAPFPERERRCAENFAAAAARAGVQRIVYLGGPTASWMDGAPDTGADDRPTRTTSAGGEGHAPIPADLSRHLRSREAVERVLRTSVPDTVALHASIVVGARSRSFRFMVRLVERMPVLALPSWRVHRTRPIDGRDVTDMLIAAGAIPSAAGRSFDIGGPDILTYGVMIERIAESMLLSRPTLGLGVSVTPIAAPVAAAIAGEDVELVGPLMESLGCDLLPDGPTGDAHLRAAEALGVRLHSYNSAVEHALGEWESVEPLAAR